MTTTIGHDAEVFLKDKRSLDYVPSIGLVGGTKEVPLPCNKGALQEDNVMAELNIDPATTAEEFVGNTIIVLDQLKEKIAPHNLEVAYDATAIFEPHYLEHPQAKLIGCDPDYNAYSMRHNEVSFTTENTRCCGGHVHIGFDGADSHPLIRKKLAILCDLYLGLPSLLLDDDNQRRKMYGKAGSHRPKPYGVEYRVLSNFWLKSDKYMEWVFNSAVRAVDALRDGVYESLQEGWGLSENRIERYINNGGDEDEILFWLEQYRIDLPEIKRKETA